MKHKNIKCFCLPRRLDGRGSQAPKPFDGGVSADLAHENRSESTQQINSEINHPAKLRIIRGANTEVTPKKRYEIDAL
jgi:hypothetical protein